MRTIKTPDGRVFTYAGTRPYTRKDGAAATVEDWTGHCRHPDCGKSFTVTAPAGADLNTTKAFGRVHCQDHKLTRAECLALASAAYKAKRLSAKTS